MGCPQAHVTSVGLVFTVFHGWSLEANGMLSALTWGEGTLMVMPENHVGLSELQFLRTKAQLLRSTFTAVHHFIGGTESMKGSASREFCGTFFMVHILLWLLKKMSLGAAVVRGKQTQF